MTITELEKEDLAHLVVTLTQENALLKFKMHQLTDNAINFGDYICNWLETHRYKWQQSTYEGYFHIVTNHIAPYFREKRYLCKA